MTTADVSEILGRYDALFETRFGRRPNRDRCDRQWASTLIAICGGNPKATEALLAWFDSSDPWYLAQGFELVNIFNAINRLVGTGVLEPNGGPDLRRAVRNLAAVLVEPRLRLVR